MAIYEAGFDPICVGPFSSCINYRDVQMMLDNRTISYVPKNDITTFELAKLMPVLLAGVTGRLDAAYSMFDALPNECKRHFSVNE